MDNHEVIISKTPEGFVAAATSSPYFCFIEPTEAAVIARVEKALVFYHKAHEGTAFIDKIPAPASMAITRLIPSRRIATKELALA